MHIVSRIYPPVSQSSCLQKQRIHLIILNQLNTQMIDRLMHILQCYIISALFLRACSQECKSECVSETPLSNNGADGKQWQPASLIHRIDKPCDWKKIRRVLQSAHPTKRCLRQSVIKKSHQPAKSSWGTTVNPPPRSLQLLSTSISHPVSSLVLATALKLQILKRQNEPAMHLVFCGCFKWEHGVEIHSAKPTLRDKALTFFNSSGQLSYTSSDTIGFKHQQQMTSENPYLFRMGSTSFPEVFVCKYTLVWPKGTSRGLYDIAKQAISMSQVKICYMKFHFTAHLCLYVNNHI